MMIAKSKHLVTAAVALCSLVVSASGQPTDVLSLGVGRGYDNGDLFQIVLTGTSMDTARAALEADGFAFVPGESFTEADLAGHEIVFLGLFDPSEALTPDEGAAVEAFVRGGGALVYLGDSAHFWPANASVGGLFGVVYDADPDATSASAIPDPSHPIISGPAGDVAEYDGTGNVPGFFGGISELGPYAHAVLGTDDRTVVAVIERDVLEPGSGPVVFLSEANGFLEDGLGTVHLGDNLTLLRNVFWFVRGPCTSDTDCDDGVFCNGAESCDVGTGLCQPGAFPCTGGEGCLEDLDVCGACTADAQCDNLVFCDGEEACNGGVCEPGAFPCDGGEACLEDAGTCGPCTIDAQCDNLVFCDGTETCNSGVCEPGVFPCDGGEGCLEDAGTCGPCTADAQCDNFVFCDGVETCDGGVCEPGVFPCDGSEGCLEDENTCGPCTADAQCDDRLFCTGAEICDTGSGDCLSGMFPCTGSEGCLENQNTCGPCTANAHCDDGLYCTGTEICVGGICEPGVFPCEEGEVCYEDTQSCGPCTEDAQCVDDRFCNGIETCNEATGVCEPGDAVDCSHVADPCNFGECDEGDEACKAVPKPNGTACDDGDPDTCFDACYDGACIGGDCSGCGDCPFDVNTNGAIDTGDYGAFLGCFGKFTAGVLDPCFCFDINTNGAVDTGDYGAFLGCFGEFCPCPDGTRSYRSSNDGVAIHLVASASAETPDHADELPSSIGSVAAGDTFFVHVWVSRGDGPVDGLACAFASMQYDAADVSAESMQNADDFSVFAAELGEGDEGLLPRVGGCVTAESLAQGMPQRWARLATIRMRVRELQQAGALDGVSTGQPTKGVSGPSPVQEADIVSIWLAAPTGSIERTSVVGGEPSVDVANVVYGEVFLRLRSGLLTDETVRDAGLRSGPEAASASEVLER